MALVAYDNSDVSDSEEEEEPQSSSANISAPERLVSSSKEENPEENVDSSNNTESSVSSGGLFSALPIPQSRLGPITTGQEEEEEEDDFMNVKNSISSSIRHQKAKEGKPVRIVIPALSELPEVEEPSTVKRRPSSGSGLLSMLPEPKQLLAKATNKSLIPHSVAKQAKKPVQSKPASSSQVVNQARKVTTSTSNLKGNREESDEEEVDHDAQIDFFSLNEDLQPPPEANSNVADSLSAGPTLEAANSSSQSYDMSYANESQVSSSSGLSHYSAMTVDRDLIQNYQASSSSHPSQSTDDNEANFNANNEDPLLSDEGFLRLHGRKKRGKDDIQIIDVSQDDQLPKPEEWLNQVLSQEAEYHPSRKRGCMPTSQQRRKHQITYLAFQAKQREVELKNMWAENRMTRRQTQAKYGF